MNSLTADQVKAIMQKESEDSAWASETLKFVLSTIDECEEKPNPTWMMGELSTDILDAILLPEHRHELSENPTEPISFPDDTSVVEALRILKEVPEMFANTCREHIEALSESMLIHGFHSTLMLEKKDGDLYHLDGLHRLLALQVAIEKGLERDSIPCIYFESTI